MNDSPAQSKGRFRFSILNLLLLTAIVALSITVAMQWREVGPLRRDVRRLRAEVGELYIVDPSKIHAMKVETDNPLEWKWRIWIPKKGRYGFGVKTGKIPREGGYGSSFMSTEISKGKHVVRFVVRRLSPDRNEWRGTLHAADAFTGGVDCEWPSFSSSISEGRGVGKGTSAFEPTEIVDLLRYRVGDREGAATTNISDPSDSGFLVWFVAE